MTYAIIKITHDKCPDKNAYLFGERVYMKGNDKNENGVRHKAFI